MTTHPTCPWLLVFLIAIAYPTPSETIRESNYRPIVSIATDRLYLMPEVAKVKWNKQSPIEDRGREETLLRDLLKDVPLRHRKRIKQMIEAQILASKIVQKELFKIWSTQGYVRFEETRDLQNELRPKITSLTKELIETALNDCRKDVSSVPDLQEPMIVPFQIALEGIKCFSDDQ